MENVPNLASKANHEFLEHILDSLRFALAQRFYYVAYSIQRSSEHGVAPRRERLIVLGTRIDVANIVGLDSDESILRLFPLPSHGMVTIRSALRDLRQKTEILNLGSGHREKRAWEH
jgi:site-specific DNA-cytosine methylase